MAMKELKQFAGRQFDEQLVQVFYDAYSSWEDLESEITEEYISSNFKRAA
jgi:HD-GYP domain-containing protein (c-di-GMP phosphodiesterase class II)